MSDETNKKTSIKKGNKNIRLPGLRNLKTALSILVCLVVYQVLGRDNEVIAIIAAIICIQDSVDKSFTEGLNRILGTAIGGACGLLLLLTNFSNYGYLAKDICITVLVVLIIYCCNIANKPKLIVNSVFVFILVVLVPDGELTPMSYAINRIVDTLIGTIIAVIINRFVYPPEEERLIYKRTEGTLIQLKKDCIYKKPDEYKQSSLGKNEAVELLIYPKDSLYEQYNFQYRISVSKIDGDSELLMTPNYNRLTMIIDGETTFVHENSHTVHLKQFDQDYFSGNVNTYCKDKSTNFNIMYKDGHKAEIKAITNGEHNDLLSIYDDEKSVFENSIFYSLYDQNVITITKDGFVAFVHILNKGETIIFRKLHHFSLDELVINISNQSIKDKKKVVCIRSNIS